MHGNASLYLRLRHPFAFSLLQARCESLQQDVAALGAANDDLRNTNEQLEGQVVGLEVLSSQQASSIGEKQAAEAAAKVRCLIPYWLGDVLDLRCV